MRLQILGLTAALVLLLAALPGCTSTKIVCPPLSPPPSSIVDALESTGRKDPNASAWTIGLSKHYQKLDACR